MSQSESIVVVRLGAMGDILHALPAVASLKRSFSGRKLMWVVRPKWIPLLAGNPFIDEIVPFGKNSLAAAWNSWKRLHEIRPALALDFQGLVQSALIGRLTRPVSFWGFDKSVARERIASLFYTNAESVTGPHRIERNLQLVRAAGADTLVHETWLPAGSEEGHLPPGPFVLSSPFAGWEGKQWPLERYQQLGKLLSKESISLVANVAGHQTHRIRELQNVHVHESSIPGLIYATRQAAAVVGVDSGPLHIAAALKKPGVAVFGPTDPAATGPYGSTLSVLRAHDVTTTYNRHSTIHASMRRITAEEVFEELMRSLDRRDRLVQPA